jgi:putative YhdH/YhfP family quinone oxidoreductase
VPATAFPALVLTSAADGVRADVRLRSLEDLDAGDVVIRVAYSSVNYKDALAATGAGKVLRRPTCIGGIDLAGTVESSTDTRFAPGDLVLATGYALGVSHHGGYAGYARLPADWVLPLPSGLSPWEAMALGTAGFTAGLAVVRMEQNGLRPSNGPVIVTGATGGVGSIAIAALARLGYRVTAFTGKAGETDYLMALGAVNVLARTPIDPASIRPLGKATWAGAVDNLGGDVLAWLASTMQVNGVIASVGLAQRAELHTTVMPFILRGVSLLGINSSDSPDRAQRTDVWRRLATDLRPPQLDRIARTIPLADLPSVFPEFIAGRIRGRVVVDVTPSVP